MTRLRWLLARAIAPSPIMADPFPGSDGVTIMYRQGDVSWSLQAKRFRLKSTTSAARLDLDGDRPFSPTYKPNFPFVRFVGTV